MAGSTELARIRLVVLNRLKQNPIACFETTTAVIALAATDPRKAPVVPYVAGGKIAKSDEYMGIVLMLEAQDGVDAGDAGTRVRIPVTFKDLDTGWKREGFLQAGRGDAQNRLTFVADGTIFDADEDKLWGWFRVPVGMQIVFGHRNQFNSRMNVIVKDDT